MGGDIIGRGGDDDPAAQWNADHKGIECEVREFGRGNFPPLHALRQWGWGIGQSPE